MTIEKINNLVIEEQNKCLRKPIGAENLTNEDALDLKRLLTTIRWYLNDEKERGFVGCLFRRIIMKKEKRIISTPI